MSNRTFSNSQRFRNHIAQGLSMHEYAFHVFCFCAGLLTAQLAPPASDPTLIALFEKQSILLSQCSAPVIPSQELRPSFFWSFCGCIGLGFVVFNFVLCIWLYRPLLPPPAPDLRALDNPSPLHSITPQLQLGSIGSRRSTATTPSSRRSSAS